jgi:hypothetical protein
MDRIRSRLRRPITFSQVESDESDLEPLLRFAEADRKKAPHRRPRRKKRTRAKKGDARQASDTSGAS